MMDAKHPLEDESLDRDYALEMALWRLLSLCQDMLIEAKDPSGVDGSTMHKIRRAVLHWRNNPDLYLKHKAWLERYPYDTKDSTDSA